MANLLLWGEGFDESIAVAMTARLRQAGLRVLLVGLQGRMAFGQDGIGLTVDLSVSQALPYAQTATSVIVPGHSPQIGLLDNDPRIGQLLDAANKNGAIFVTGNAAPYDIEIFPAPPHRILVCPTPQEGIPTAEKLLQTLQAIKIA